MNTPSPNCYKHDCFPTEIISHGVWLYFRCCLSDRDVEALLLARGMMVTDATLVTISWVCAILDERRLWHHRRGIT